MTIIKYAEITKFVKNILDIFFCKNMRVSLHLLVISYCARGYNRVAFLQDYSLSDEVQSNNCNKEMLIQYISSSGQYMTLRGTYSW